MLKVEKVLGDTFGNMRNSHLRNNTLKIIIQNLIIMPLCSMIKITHVKTRIFLPLLLYIQRIYICNIHINIHKLF